MSDVAREPRSYGGWTKPGFRGLAGLSLGVTALLGLSGPVVVMVFAFGNKILAGVLVLLVLGAAAGLALRGPMSQRTLLGSIGVRWRKGWLVRQGGAVLAQGPVGFTADGSCRLPGLVAQSELWEGRDGFGQQFAVVRVPAAGHWTVVIECAASGQDMLDERVFDRQVASWGAWLAHLGQDHNDIAGAQTVVETTPDPGVRLRRLIESQASPHAAQLARDVMSHVGADYSAETARISTRVTVTFDERMPGSAEKRSPEQMLVRIGNALPGLIAGLASSGGGHAPRAMRPADLTDAIRVAFDPVVAEDVEKARAEGGTGLTWSEAGPSFLDDRRPDHLEHDRAHSKSWQMTSPPRNSVPHDVMRRLLAPHPAVAMKRVSLLYRPLDLEESAHVADMQVTNATFAVTNSRRVGAREELRLRQAQQTAHEEVRGASLVMFGVVATATVLDVKDLPAAEAAMRELSASARLRMRPATRLQASVFTAGLPVGLVLPDLLSMPQLVREAV